MDDTGPRVLPVPLAGIILALLALTAAAVFSTAQSAHAEISGPCTATIAGADVGPLDSESTGDAIDVDDNADIVATMSATQGFKSHEIKLRFLGGIIPDLSVETRTDSGQPSFTETVHVSDYAWAGVGLYRVSGVATLSDGTHCTGAVLVNVTGRNPLTTVAGGVAAGVAVLGTVGTLTSGVAASGSPGALASTQASLDNVGQASGAQERQRRLEEWVTRPDSPNIDFAAWLLGFSWFGCLCLAVLSVVLMPLMLLMGAMPGGAGGASRPPAAAATASEPRRIRRPRWGPRITLVGLVSGVLAGAALLVLLQQFAVVYPTIEWAICLPVIGAVVYGLVVPTIGYTIAWRRVNTKVTRLEHELGWS